MNNSTACSLSHNLLPLMIPSLWTTVYSLVSQLSWLSIGLILFLLHSVRNVTYISGIPYMTGAEPTAFFSLHMFLDVARAWARVANPFRLLPCIFAGTETLSFWTGWEFSEPELELELSDSKNILMHSMDSLSMSLSVTSHKFAITYWAPPIK